MKRLFALLAFLLLSAPALAQYSVESYPNSVGRYDGGPSVAAAIDTINYNCSTFFTCTGSPGTGPTATFTLGLANNAFTVLPSVTVDNTNDLCAFYDNSGAVMARTACTNIGAGGGGGAPTGATYITQTADATLTAEQALGALTTGLSLHTTTTGVISTYGGTSCTNQFPRSLNASGAATCASVASADITDATIAQADVASGNVIDPLETSVSWFREDFDKDGTGGSVVSGWYVALSGGSFPEIASVTDHPGIRALTSGAGATDYAYVGRGNKEIMFSGGATVAKTSINIQNLSDVTDEYDFYWGHLDGIATTYVDGVFFKYDRNTSVNWLMVTCNNAVCTTTATAEAVATGWHKLEIRVNAAGTSAAFFYDGVEATNSPLTTNIPTARDTGHVTIIQKSAGTASRAVWLDYWFFRQILTAAR